MFGQNSRELAIILKLKDDMSKQLKTVQTQAEALKPTFKKIAAAGGVAFGAMSLAMKNFVAEGTESQQIAESFHRMTQDVGIQGDLLVAKLKEMSAGTVSTTDLMLASNRAMALGVGKDMGTITQLMEIARLKGRALGLTTTQAFNDIVTGIGRGSPLILDNLGITIKLNEAHRLYAEQLGKTTEELTDQEKSQSLLNAVLQQGAKEVKNAGELQKTASESVQELRAAFDDMRSAIGEALLPAVVSLTKAIQPIIERVGSWISQNPELASKIMIVVTAVAGLTLAIGTLGLAIPSIIGGFYALGAALTFAMGPLGILITGVGIAAAVIGGKFLNSVTTATASVNQLQNTVNQFADPLAGQSRAAQDFGGAVSSIGDSAKESADRMKELKKEVMEVVQSIVKDEKESSKNLAEALIEQEEKVASLRKEIRELEKTEKSREDAKRLRELEANLEKEEQALENNSFIRVQFADQVAEAERRASLTAFDRRVEDIMALRQERVKDHLKRLEEIKQEVAAEIGKNTQIKASFVAAHEAMREESTKTLQQIVDDTLKQKNAFESAISAFDRFQHRTSTASTIEGRASGGPVSRGRPYIVGEQGPELFVPGNSGTIIPNKATRSVASGSGPIHIHLNVDGREISETVFDRLMGELKANVKLA